jgi:ribosomal protein S18 acetylase RimI-like enzyme
MDRKPGPLLDDYEAMIKNGYVNIAEIDGVIQGVLVLVPGDGSMLLNNVAVAPSVQGLGLGGKLMRYAERRARAAGYQSITLYTNEIMKRNINYYSRLGYVETDRYEDKGYKRVFMAKTLP